MMLRVTDCRKKFMRGVKIEVQHEFYLHLLLFYTLFVLPTVVVHSEERFKFNFEVLV